MFHLIIIIDYQVNMKNRLEHLKGNFNNFGKEVFFVDTTDSTMTLAWDYIDTEKSGGALIFTDYQTQGKGRYNRKWISQPKKIYYYP